MNKIYILGLGPGEYDKISLKVLDKIKKAALLYVRTADHPAVKELARQDIPMIFFDEYYEALDEDFEKVYEKIVETLVEAAEQAVVYYAVPGHPRVAEATVKMLTERYPEATQVIGGQSFLDDFFEAIAVDPVEEFQLLDAFTLDHKAINPRQHVVIMQVAHSLLASHVKMELMTVYPEEHAVYLVDAAGTSQEKVEKLPLYELDFFDDVHNLRTLYVPPLKRDEDKRDFQTLMEYMEAIHDPDSGDVWVNQATQKELADYLQQEVQEYIETLMEDDPVHQVEEIGDVWMVVMDLLMSLEREEYYSVYDVLEKINEKIRFRHPHVFDGVQAETIAEVDAIWQERKRLEKERKDHESR